MIFALGTSKPFHTAQGTKQCKISSSSLSFMNLLKNSPPFISRKYNLRQVTSSPHCIYWTITRTSCNRIYIQHLELRIFTQAHIHPHPEKVLERSSTIKDKHAAHLYRCNAPQESSRLEADWPPRPLLITSSPRTPTWTPPWFNYLDPNTLDVPLFLFASETFHKKKFFLHITSS